MSDVKFPPRVSLYQDEDGRVGFSSGGRNARTKYEYVSLPEVTHLIQEAEARVWEEAANSISGIGHYAEPRQYFLDKAKAIRAKAGKEGV